jgi:hypothetical protein
MAAAGRKGHLAVVDMKNMSLIKEMQVCPGVAKLNEMQLGSRCDLLYKGYLGLEWIFICHRYLICFTGIFLYQAI